MENSTLDENGRLNLSSTREESVENGAQKIYAANDHQMKDTEFKGHKNDSFIVDIEQFSSLLPEKDANANSRISLQKNVSRKGMQRGTEQKTNFSFNNDRNHSPRANSAKGALHGTSTLERPSMVGATENSINPQHHNSITIMNCGGGGGGSAAAAAAAAVDGKLGGRRYSFRRPSSSWTIDPRRILFFFATLSSMGTILLIYFTLSMSKVKGDDGHLN